MTPETLILLCIAVGLIALLYASVGHGGASGYIAVMVLASIPAMVIKPTELSSIIWYQELLTGIKQIAP